MAAVNLYPWIGNLGGASEPLTIILPVKAGGTKAIKMGELCTWNETTGYVQPIDAAADIKWNLLFAAEEISSMNTPQAKYAYFFVPRPKDVFEIELASAAAIEVGDNYEPTGTNSETATLDADGDPVFVAVGQGNYPSTDKFGGTTVRSVPRGQFTVNKAYSYYRQLVRDEGTHKKIINVTAALTLLAEWSGAIITNNGATGAVQVDLPQDCPKGTFFEFSLMADQALRLHSAGGGIYIAGAKQADSKYISMTDIADFAKLVCVGANDWLATASISGADADITVET